MKPYDECVFTRERLKQYDGFGDMTDEELDKALMLMYTLSSAYLMNKNKIDEYERNKLRVI